MVETLPLCILACKRVKLRGQMRHRISGRRHGGQNILGAHFPGLCEGPDDGRPGAGGAIGQGFHVRFLRLDCVQRHLAHNNRVVAKLQTRSFCRVFDILRAFTRAAFHGGAIADHGLKACIGQLLQVSCKNLRGNGEVGGKITNVHGRSLRGRAPKAKRNIAATRANLDELRLSKHDCHVKIPARRFLTGIDRSGFARAFPTRVLIRALAPVSEDMMSPPIRLEKQNGIGAIILKSDDDGLLDASMRAGIAAGLTFSLLKLI